MSSREHIPNDILDLIHRAHDGMLSNEEIRLLENHLEGNQAACDLFLEYARLEGRLLMEHQEVQAFRPLRKIIDGAAKSPDSTAQSSSGRSVSKRHVPRPDLRGKEIWGWAGSALAGCLLTAVWFGYATPTTEVPLARAADILTPAAQITSSYQTESKDISGTVSTRTRGLPPGEIVRIHNGVVSLDFTDGGHVVLEGPAIVEIVSPSACRLYEGKVVATADDASPFVVTTRGGDVELASATTVIVAEPAGAARFQQLRGESSIAVPQSSGKSHQIRLPKGRLVVLGVDGGLSESEAVPEMNIVPRVPARRDAPPFDDSIVMLGNLFDDSTTATLTEAMHSDAFCAVAETTDLGIAAAFQTGLDIDVRLARNGPAFNFSNAGGSYFAGFLATNDGWREPSRLPIRTTGKQYVAEDVLETRIEQGIGMSANSLVTFDLGEIREAGQLENRAMKFVADRVGINDSIGKVPDVTKRSVNVAVVVSTETEPIAGYINGNPVKLARRGDVYSFDGEETRLMKSLRYNYVAFDVPLPPNARYLTFASLAGANTNADHAVLSGARLELIPDQQELASRMPLRRQLGDAAAAFGRLAALEQYDWSQL